MSDPFRTFAGINKLNTLLKNPNQALSKQEKKDYPGLFSIQDCLLDNDLDFRSRARNQVFLHRFIEDENYFYTTRHLYFKKLLKESFPPQENPTSLETTSIDIFPKNDYKHKYGNFDLDPKSLNFLNQTLEHLAALNSLYIGQYNFSSPYFKDFCDVIRHKKSLIRLGFENVTFQVSNQEYNYFCDTIRAPRFESLTLALGAISDEKLIHHLALTLKQHPGLKDLGLVGHVGLLDEQVDVKTALKIYDQILEAPQLARLDLSGAGLFKVVERAYNHLCLLLALRKSKISSLDLGRNKLGIFDYLTYTHRDGTQSLGAHYTLLQDLFLDLCGLIHHLPQLIELGLRGNDLNCLPVEKAKFLFMALNQAKKLEAWDLSDNCFHSGYTSLNRQSSPNDPSASLPLLCDAIQHAPQLRHLNLSRSFSFIEASNTEIRNMTRAFAHSKKLISVNLSGNDLDRISPENLDFLCEAVTHSFIQEIISETPLPPKLYRALACNKVARMQNVTEVEAEDLDAEFSDRLCNTLYRTPSINRIISSAPPYSKFAVILERNRASHALNLACDKHPEAAQLIRLNRGDDLTMEKNPLFEAPPKELLQALRKMLAAEKAVKDEQALQREMMCFSPPLIILFRDCEEKLEKEIPLFRKLSEDANLPPILIKKGFGSEASHHLYIHSRTEVNKQTRLEESVKEQIFLLSTQEGKLLQPLIDSLLEKNSLVESSSRYDLLLMNAPPTKRTFLPGKNSAFVLVQPRAGAAPTELYFVDRTGERRAVIQFVTDSSSAGAGKCLFPPGQTVTTFTTAFYSRVENHDYPPIYNLSHLQLQQAMLISGYNRIDNNQTIRRWIQKAPHTIYANDPALTADMREFLSLYTPASRAFSSALDILDRQLQRYEKSLHHMLSAVFFLGFLHHFSFNYPVPQHRNPGFFYHFNVSYPRAQHENSPIADSCFTNRFLSALEWCTDKENNLLDFNPQDFQSFDRFLAQAVQLQPTLSPQSVLPQFSATEIKSLRVAFLQYLFLMEYSPSILNSPLVVDGFKTPHRAWIWLMKLQFEDFYLPAIRANLNDLLNCYLQQGLALDPDDSRYRPLQLLAELLGKNSAGKAPLALEHNSLSLEPEATPPRQQQSPAQVGYRKLNLFSSALQGPPSSQLQQDQTTPLSLHR